VHHKNLIFGFDNFSSFVFIVFTFSRSISNNTEGNFSSQKEISMERKFTPGYPEQKATIPHRSSRTLIHSLKLTPSRKQKDNVQLNCE